MEHASSIFAFIFLLTCHPCVRLSPPCPPVTPVSACHHWSACHPRVRLSPLCLAVTTGPPVTTVSVCHHCVRLSPLCLAVTSVFTALEDQEPEKQSVHSCALLPTVLGSVLVPVRPSADPLFAMDASVF